MKTIMSTFWGTFRKVFSFIILFALAFVAFALVNKSPDYSDIDKEFDEYFRKNYKVFAVNIPDKIDFCGEACPVDRFDIHESLDKELLSITYWHSQTLQTIKKANRYFPIIEPILKQNGIPDDFKYLCITESMLTNAISTANAVGFWQFLDKTGISYGLEINEEVDERYDVVRSTHAACKYFKDAYAKFGNWTMVAASYNMGMGGLKEQSTRQQTNNYYDLHLNQETGRYVYRILANKILFQSPSSYGFYFRFKDLYPVIPTRKLTVDTAINDLVAFSINAKSNYKMLKLFNPWLRKTKLSNKLRKKYTIEFPVEGSMNYSVLTKDLEEKDRKWMEQFEKDFGKNEENKK
ncbi:MAG: lytic transglycosylase domain-containing protein [Bacteroidota bacterium]